VPSVRIALVGDYQQAATAHRAIPRALGLCEAALGVPVVAEWIPTPDIADASRLEGYDGIWCVPASPYRDMDGALRAIECARTSGRPFLGTCGGFQHAVIEYARNVLGWADADHAETSPQAARAVIAPLACSLVEDREALRLRDGSRLAAAYGRADAIEGYHCRFGLNPAFQQALVTGPVQIAAENAAGEIRALELEGHAFYVLTLFQPERAALADRVPPIVQAFVRAALSGPRAPEASAPARA
jgi:CTP synthase (UTP-ammonia lyase)